MSLQSVAHVNGYYLKPTSVFATKRDFLFLDSVGLGAKRSNRRLLGTGASALKSVGGFPKKRNWSCSIKSVLDFDRVDHVDAQQPSDTKRKVRFRFFNFVDCLNR